MDVWLAIPHDVFPALNCDRHFDLPINGQRSLHEEGKSAVQERDQDAVFYTSGVWQRLPYSMVLGQRHLALKQVVRL